MHAINGTEPAVGVYTAKEAAKVLGISVNLVYESMRRGDIPCVEFGRRKVIPRAALDALLLRGCDSHD